jgi:hypothetical protein
LRERDFLFNTSLASLTLTQGTNLFTYNLYENIVCNKKVRRINKWIYFLSESLRFGFVEKQEKDRKEKKECSTLFLRLDKMRTILSRTNIYALTK